MTLKSYELCPLTSTEHRLNQARAAYRDLMAKVGRTYVPRKALDLSFPNNPREGGILNQLGPNDLFGWLIMDDRLALDQAVATGKWLWSERAGWDRAHRQRIPWFAMTYRAAIEAGIADADCNFLVDGFNSDVGRTVGEKYLISFVGSTTRPLVRTLGAAIMLAEVEMSISGTARADLVTMRDRAIKQWNEWAWAEWRPGIRWGWLGEEDGYWKAEDPLWRRFPYLGGSDPIDAAQEDTWFHYGIVVPYEAMIAEMYADLSDHVRQQVRKLCRHALAYGYDDVTGRTLKSIGWKRDGDRNAGCMAPGFHDGAWPDASEWEKDSFLEMGHFDLAPAIYAAGKTREGRRAALIEWAKKCRAIGREGEVPVGTVAIAVKLGFGQ